MVKCPRCGFQVKDKPNRKWRYGTRGMVRVAHYHCKSCLKGFMLYRTPKGREYTTPKARSRGDHRPVNRHRKRINLDEPAEFVRIAITVPKDLLQAVDNAARLYSQPRSGLIQKELREATEDLIGLDWIKEIFQQRDIKRKQGYDIDKLIHRLFDWAPAAGDAAFYLTPEQLDYIRVELEKEGLKKNEWLLFCQKCKLDHEKILDDRAIKCVPPEELISADKHQ